MHREQSIHARVGQIGRRRFNPHVVHECRSLAGTRARLEEVAALTVQPTPNVVPHEGTLRRIDVADPAATDSRDWLRTASIAYAFTEALEGSLGWARSRTDGTTGTTLGALLTYKLEF
jgi:hypothetical protein